MELMLPTENDLSAAIKVAFDDLADDLGNMSDAGVYETKVESVDHEPYSGFIPWTNGGWTGTGYVNFQDAKESWNCLAKYVAVDDAMFYEELRTKLRAELNEEGILDETVFDALADETLYEHFDEQYEDFEQEWRDADGDVFFLYWRAIYYAKDNSRNKSGEDEIYFFAGVNTDFNYGRDSIAWAGGSCYACEWEQNVPVTECTPEKIDEIKKAILKFYKEA